MIDPDRCRLGFILDEKGESQYVVNKRCENNMIERCGVAVLHYRRRKKSRFCGWSKSTPFWIYLKGYKRVCILLWYHHPIQPLNYRTHFTNLWLLLVFSCKFLYFFSFQVLTVTTTNQANNSEKQTDVSLENQQNVQSETELEVFYIDFGDTEWISLTEVRLLLPRFMKLPSQVVRCSLANIKPFMEEGCENTDPGNTWFQLSINKSITQSVNRSIDQPNYQSIIQSINQSIKQSFNQSFNQSINQSIKQSVS